MLGLLGQLARDRALLLMLLMFVPLLPVALAALAWDLWWKGRSLAARWLLSAVAVICGTYFVAQQWQPALGVQPGSMPRVRVVQWNTQWGGRSPQAFRRIVDTLDAQQADVAFLSEAPNMLKLRDAWRGRHAGWHSAAVSSGRRQAYWYNLVVLSRYPLQLTAESTLARGHTALFNVALPIRTLRVLLVDIESSPFVLRSPNIREVATLVDKDRRAHPEQPIDLVLGDFNTPAHLLGFDALAAAGGGMARAAMWSGAWRATWPSFVPVPLYDIDHVWVSRRWHVQRASFFSCWGSDHRGQAVDIQPAW